jgi:hypothetical protein
MDRKLRSLWPWNKLQPKISESNTIPPDDEDTLSDEYESEKEKYKLKAPDWSSISVMCRRRAWESR